MEREIANVAAASAMHGFRYMAFPPIVFDAPMTVEALEWTAPHALPLAAHPVELLPLQAAVQRVEAATPPATRDSGSAPTRIASPLPQPVATRPIAQPPPERRFALLAEVSAQLGRQAPP